MFSPRTHASTFVLEGLNALGTSWYFYYIYFFLSERFGFGPQENLLFGVAHGAIYVVGSFLGGRLGQRRGYLGTARLGFGGMAAAFAAGALLEGRPGGGAALVAGQVAVMVAATVAVCLTWANLEALVSEGLEGPRLQRNLGIYNLVWAGGNAVAFFVGGALIERLGFGVIFWLPAGLMAVMTLLATFVGRGGVLRLAGGTGHGHVAPAAERRHADRAPKAFLRMAWLANPCAYIAISAAVPVIPALAARFDLGTAAAGAFASLWFFVRFIVFGLLWRWSGWHYRFRWLLVAYVAMVAGFLGIFTLPTLALVAAAQVLFGAGVGLIYYSSLFYSMDVGATKGEHGGIHEAALGAGILAGPLIGAAAKLARPDSFAAPAWAVSAALAAGLAGVWWLRGRRR
ncbi:MAG: MFS transporter [Limisphaerales bacterium]